MKTRDAFVESVLKSVQRLEAMVVTNPEFKSPARPYTEAVLQHFDSRHQRRVVRALRQLERQGRIQCLSVPESEREKGRAHKYWRSLSLLETLAVVSSSQKSMR